MTHRHAATLALALALLTGAAPVAAHDTWFQAVPGPAPTAGASAATATELTLGTGAHVPRYDSAVGLEFIARQGCTDAAGRARPGVLALRRYEAQATVLRAPAGARSCWAQLVPMTITLGPDKVAVYLDEIRASDAVRQAWAGQQQRGLAWQERYTKHARIDLGTAAAVPNPVPMAMDVLWEPAPDGGHRFTVWRDGQPLPDLPVELRSDLSPIGLWRRTDAQGRVQLPALPAGRWVLRGTDLRPSDEQPDSWDSRFLTLAFEVPAAPSVPAARPASAPR